MVWKFAGLENKSMNPKIILCLALVLSGAFIFPLAIPFACRGDDTNIVHNDKIHVVDDIRTTVIKIPGLKDRIFFTEQPTLFTVQMVVANYRVDEKHTFPEVDELHRQVWLLRADGTSLPQSQKPDIIGISNAGSSDCRLIFTFQKKSMNEVAGIVVSVDGKLYCYEIEKGHSKS
jgi:hypothetical protein